MSITGGQGHDHMIIQKQPINHHHGRNYPDSQTKRIQYDHMMKIHRTGPSRRRARALSKQRPGLGSDCFYILQL
jgi:hypothetical protein